MAKSEKSKEHDKGDNDGKRDHVSSIVWSPHIFQRMPNVFFYRLVGHPIQFMTVSDIAILDLNLWPEKIYQIFDHS